VSGFLTSVLILAGTHFNKEPGPFSVAFKLMLRIMAVHPLISFLLLLPLGDSLSLLVYGLFVIRGVRKTYPIPVEKIAVFYGAIYFIFALMQLQQIISPPSAEKYQDLFKQTSHVPSTLPPSGGTIRTSSSKMTSH
ncbi:MAG: hypothetical protein HY074_17555, partial [Deltaproteobacteria bacterium]|nr:hypothetical protein [Deltaproteobacteria bacterium]